MRQNPKTPLGIVGKLGRWTAGHFRLVAAAWLVVALGLGALAPRAEHALSGAGWEATGSESVQARQLIDRHFEGAGSYRLTAVVHSRARTTADPGFRQVVRNVQAELLRDPAVQAVAAPVLSRDRRTASIQAGAARDANAMVRSADALKDRLARLGTGGVQVDLTGGAGMWCAFNQA